MNLKQINDFEKPIFETYSLERNRIFASEVIFRIMLSEEEFWDNFFDYTFKRIVKEVEFENLKINSILNIKDESGKMKSFIVSQFEYKKKLELASLSGGNLNKIYIETSNTKFEKEINVKYIESKRTNEMNEDKEYKRKFSIYNSRIVNKVIILKEYLLNKVREKK